MSESLSPHPAKPPFATLMAKLGLAPDPWQLEVLEGGHPRLLLNCSRQAGKSTVVAVLSLLEALWVPGTLVLLLSRSHRQAYELFRRVLEYHRRLGRFLLDRKSGDELLLTNYSRIVCLPCQEETIRGYSGVSLLVIDEAARVPEDLFRAVNPMLAVSDGRMICLSTPYGKRGFFWEAWSTGGDDWHRIEVPAAQVPRIKPEFLERQRRMMGESWYRQEYCCSFEALEGLVYPDFARCVLPQLPAHLLDRNGQFFKEAGTRVGGLDFGVRNPTAAVWGLLDHDGVLWLTGELYGREKSLAYVAQRLPRNVMWYADPAAARERLELLAAGFKVRVADNEQRPGIQAVRARLEDGTLRVLAGACPNLLAEAGLYRYDPEAPGQEAPLKEYNHAMDALRYLVSTIDYRRMARLRRGPLPEDLTGGPAAPGSAPPAAAPPKRRKWLSIYNEALWTKLT
jgi:hypothetical protein